MTRKKLYIHEGHCVAEVECSGGEVISDLRERSNLGKEAAATLVRVVKR